MSNEIQDQIVAFLVEHSPKDSGPAYRFAAENWDIIQTTLSALLILIVLGLLSIAVSLWDNG